MYKERKRESIGQMKTKKEQHERQVRVRREMDIETEGKEWDFRSEGNRKR